jgi:transcriptional regulator with XRE-family HTH domain
VDRHEFADFLRTKRELAAPTETGRRRRTPGLRREEVAQLAHISTDYYARLEQARGRHPSRTVLVGIARALRLSTEERAYLFDLAEQPQEQPPGPPTDVPPSLLTLLDRMPDSAAIVLDATYDVLAWNALAAALLEDFSATPQRDRNLIRRYFLPDGTRHQYGTSEFGVYAVGDLRAAAARYPDDPRIRALVAELRAGSAEFAGLWDSHHLRSTRHVTKKVRHRLVGDLVLNCDALAVPDRDQHLVIFTAEPGTPSDQAMQLLKVVGTQRMESGARLAGPQRDHRRQAHDHQGDHRVQRTEVRRAGAGAGDDPLDPGQDEQHDHGDDDAA